MHWCARSSGRTRRSTLGRKSPRPSAAQSTSNSSKRIAGSILTDARERRSASTKCQRSGGTVMTSPMPTTRGLQRPTHTQSFPPVIVNRSTTICRCGAPPGAPNRRSSRSISMKSPSESQPVFRKVISSPLKMSRTRWPRATGWRGALATQRRVRDTFWARICPTSHGARRGDCSQLPTPLSVSPLELASNVAPRRSGCGRSWVPRTGRKRPAETRTDLRGLIGSGGAAGSDRLGAFVQEPLLTVPQVACELAYTLAPQQRRAWRHGNLLGRKVESLVECCRRLSGDVLEHRAPAGNQFGPEPVLPLPAQADQCLMATAPFGAVGGDTRWEPVFQLDLVADGDANLAC